MIDCTRTSVVFGEGYLGESCKSYSRIHAEDTFAQFWIKDGFTNTSGGFQLRDWVSKFSGLSTLLGTWTKLKRED